MTISRFFLFIALILLNFNLLAENKNNQFIVPDDLKVIPQNVKTFASSNSSVFSSEIGSEKRFKESVTAPWRIKKNAVNINDFNKYAFAPIDKCFGLNFQTYNKDTIFDIRANANNAKSVNRNGIIVKHSDLRLTPSDLPCLHPNKPGGAYPFDDYQNSRLYIGSPVSVVAKSQDENWYLVYSHETSIGWVRSENLVFVGNSDVRFFNAHKLGVILEDRSNFKIGMFLPIHAKKKNTIELYLPEKSHNNHLHWKVVKLRNNEVAVMPIKFNQENVTKVLNNLLNKPYGWGGMYGYRDCSATMKDYFATCGLYLKRNSKAQINSDLAVRTFDLSGKSNSEKVNIIKNNGIPFRTLIYLPGHIGLYVGDFKGKPAMLHNIWGLKTFSSNDGEGREVVGKSVISTLEIGKEIVNVQSTLLERVDKMSVF